MKFYTKFIFILMSATLIVLSFYYNLGFLIWFCLVPYLIVINYSSLKQTFFFSLLLGIIYFAGVTYWFTQYSFIFWLPIVGYLTIYIIVFGIVLYFIYLKISWPALRIILISSFWLLLEFFRNRTFLAFPWGMLAYSQYNYLALMQLVKLTGVYGVSLIIILFNSTIVETILSFIKTKKIVLKYLFTMVCLIIIIVTLGFININIYKKNFENKNYDKYKKINLAMVQPNISFDEKFEKDSGVIIPTPYDLNNYFKKDTELVVFPESVIWGPLEQNATFKEWAVKTIKKENLYLIMGQILWDDKKNYYNSVVLYSPPDCKIIGRYDKIHPLPCGEYMPYPHILGFLSFLNVAKLNITPVKEFKMINYPGKGKLGINICFESTLPIISRTFRNKGAEAIFVFTDDAGFKYSIAPWQHVIFSEVRAIENSCYVIHSSSMGISAVINPIGEIISKTDLGRKEVLYQTIYLNSQKSFYSKYGNIIIYGYFGFSFILLCIFIFSIKYKK